MLTNTYTTLQYLHPHSLPTYQKDIISKIFKGITNNHRWSQSHQQTQATYIQEKDIKMSIRLIYIEDTSEKVRRILRSHRVRSTLFTENN